MAHAGTFSNLAKRVADQQLASVYCERAATFFVAVASCVWPQPNPAHCCSVTAHVSWVFFPSQATKPHQLPPAVPRRTVTHSSKAGCLHWPCVLLSLLGLLDCPLLGQSYTSIGVGSPVAHAKDPCLGLLDLPQPPWRTCTGCQVPGPSLSASFLTPFLQPHWGLLCFPPTTTPLLSP